MLMPLESEGQVAKHYSLNDTLLRDCFDFLRQWENRLTIFHFGGHADSLAIDLHDHKTSFEPLAKELLSRNPDSLQLVFLNGCATHVQVQTLFDLGAKAVIATSVAVKDEQASSFAIEFYRNLTNGETLAQAFESAAHVTQAIQGAKNPFTRGSKFIRWSEQITNQTIFPWGLYTNDDDVQNYCLVGNGGK